MMHQANAAWVGHGKGTRTHREGTILDALAYPKCRASSARAESLAGYVQGHLYAPSEQFQDEAWQAMQERDLTKMEDALNNHKQQRICDTQRVHWS